MSKHGTKYSEIKTIADLKRARKKIAIMRMVNETYLAQDIEELKYRMSPSTIIEEAKERFLSSNVWSGLLAGLRILADIRALRRAHLAEETPDNERETPAGQSWRT